MRLLSYTVLLVSLGAAACAPEVGPRVEPTGSAASWSDLEQRVLQQQCAPCHSGGTFPDLRTGTAYEALVGVASEQQPSMPLVDPGHPENSYIVAKMRGSNGALLSPMPIGGRVDDADLNAVETWIANGAEK